MERRNKAIGVLAGAALVAALVAATADSADAAERAARFLKRTEGFSSAVYNDSAGNKTIGYGFTSAVMVGRRILTENEASVELLRICRSISRRLRMELGTQRLSVNQEAALISFIYNIGWGNFKSSKMCRLLKEGKRGAEVSKEFVRWVYVTKDGEKVVSEGLRARRDKERRWFEGKRKEGWWTSLLLWRFG